MGEFVLDGEQVATATAPAVTHQQIPWRRALRLRLP